MWSRQKLELTISTHNTGKLSTQKDNPNENYNAVCLLHITWLANGLKNSQSIHSYPCEFSEDIVTSWRQHFRAINTGVFNVHYLDTRP